MLFRKRCHELLALNHNDHLDQTIGALVIGVVFGATVLSVAALFVGLASAGIFN